MNPMRQPLCSLTMAELALCACVAPSDARTHVAHGRSWTVRGENEVEVLSVGRRLEVLVRAVRRRLDAEEASVLVVLADDSTPQAAWGQTLSSGVILLDPAALGPFDVLLAHELAHAFLMADEAWTHLPSIVEEGLADLIAGEVLPGEAFSIQSRHQTVLPDRGSAQSGRRAIRTLLTEDMYGDDHTQALELRAIGFVLARRIGVDGLRSMCAESRSREYERIPADWLLEACGVGDEEVGVWERVLREADPDGWSRFPMTGMSTD